MPPKVNKKKNATGVKKKIVASSKSNSNAGVGVKVKKTTKKPLKKVEVKSQITTTTTPKPLKKLETQPQETTKPLKKEETKAKATAKHLKAAKPTSAPRKPRTTTVKAATKAPKTSVKATTTAKRNGSIAHPNVPKAVPLHPEIERLVEMLTGSINQLTMAQQRKMRHNDTKNLRKHCECDSSSYESDDEYSTNSTSSLGSCCGASSNYSDSTNTDDYDDDDSDDESDYTDDDDNFTKSSETVSTYYDGSGESKSGCSRYTNSKSLGDSDFFSGSSIYRNSTTSQGLDSIQSNENVVGVKRNGDLQGKQKPVLKSKKNSVAKKRVTKKPKAVKKASISKNSVKKPKKSGIKTEMKSRPQQKPQDHNTSVQKPLENTKPLDVTIPMIEVSTPSYARLWSDSGNMQLKHSLSPLNLTQSTPIFIKRENLADSKSRDKRCPPFISPIQLPMPGTYLRPTYRLPSANSTFKKEFLPKVNPN